MEQALRPAVVPSALPAAARRAAIAGRLMAGACLVAACNGEEGAPVAAATRAAVDSIAVDAKESRRIPGLAVVILRQDAAVVATGYGVANLEQRTPVTPETVFQLGSISKQFLAAMVMRLVERGLVSLDGPIAEHLPEFDHLPPAITIEHLLTHTSGIREPFMLPAYQQGIEDLGRSSAEYEAILKTAPVDFAPGSRWSYSNANYHLLALLVERLTRTPYEKAMQDELFHPHGLASFRQCTPLPADRAEARGYVIDGGAVVPSAPENMQWIRGDGGICGSALDLARWTRLLASGDIVHDSSYRRMIATTPTGDGVEADYGYALSLVPLDSVPRVAHNGAMAGFSATAAYYPGAELTIVVLTNLGGVATESIERPIARRVLDLPPPARTEQALDAEARRRYVGRYDIGVFTVAVTERDGRLRLEMPPPGPTAPLIHIGGGELVSATDPEAHRLRISADGRLRLSMGGMHWYGRRLP